jgi:hypothetical protein
VLLWLFFCFKSSPLHVSFLPPLVGAPSLWGQPVSQSPVSGTVLYCTVPTQINGREREERREKREERREKREEIMETERQRTIEHKQCSSETNQVLYESRQATRFVSETNPTSFDNIRNECNFSRELSSLVTFAFAEQNITSQRTVCDAVPNQYVYDSHRSSCLAEQH